MMMGFSRAEVVDLAKNLADTLEDAADKTFAVGGEPMSAFFKGRLVGACTEWLEIHFLAEDDDTAVPK
jgi:phage gpG-like protein